MSRPLPLALAQLPSVPANPQLRDFAAEVESIRSRFPDTRMAVFPELHLCGVDALGAQAHEQLREIAEPLDGPRVKALGELAGDLGMWLLPGTVCERGPEGQLYNTAVVFSPEGRLTASYRKIFPGGPANPTTRATGSSYSTSPAPGGSASPSASTPGSRKSPATSPGWAPRSSSTP